jgi:hypothetical protein
MGPQRTNLTLRLHHPTRDLLPVCTALGLAPRHAWKKGDERQTPNGRNLGGVRDSSYGSADLCKTSREPLSKKIEAALTRLEPYREVLEEVWSTGGRLSFFIGWFLDEDTGDTLDWPILQKTSQLRIELELNIYVPREHSNDDDTH